MVNKYSLDEKLKERENAVVLNEIEDSRRFVKYFVNLMEGILNYEYDELKSYFEENKTKVEIRLVEKRYRSIDINSGKCWISACIRLCSEDYSYPKLKVIELKISDVVLNYIMDIDHFLHCSVVDDADYLQMIKSHIFKDFKYDWSYNKNNPFKHTIKNKIITPSQYIIECINNYIYDDIIKPKCKTMTHDEFLNSEFKFDVDKKTQRIFDRYFFENI